MVLATIICMLDKAIENSISSVDYDTGVNLIDVASEMFGLSYLIPMQTGLRSTINVASGSTELFAGEVIHEYNGEYYRFTGDEAKTFDFNND